MDAVDIGDQYFTAEDKTLGFTIYQDPLLPDGTRASQTVVNITGWTISWMVKRKKTHADTSALITKTVGSGITIINGAAGTLQVALDDADIDDIVGGQLYYHELKRTTAASQTVLAQGTFILNQAVHALV